MAGYTIEEVNRLFVVICNTWFCRIMRCNIDSSSRTKSRRHNGSLGTSQTNDISKDMEEKGLQILMDSM